MRDLTKCLVFGSSLLCFACGGDSEKPASSPMIAASSPPAASASAQNMQDASIVESTNSAPLVLLEPPPGPSCPITGEHRFGISFRAEASRESPHLFFADFRANEAHVALVRGGALFVDLDLPEFHARGFAQADSLQTKRTVKFGDFLTLDPGALVRFAGAGTPRDGHVKIAPPQLAWFSFDGEAPTVDLECADITFGDVGPPAVAKVASSFVELSGSRDAYASTDGAVLATVTDAGLVPVRAKQPGFLQVARDDVFLHAIFWVKDSGLTVKKMNPTEHFAYLTSHAQLTISSGPPQKKPSMRQPGPPPDSHAVKCTEITLAFKDESERAPAPIATFNNIVLAVLEMSRSPTGFTRVQLPAREGAGFWEENGVRVFARNADLTACAIAENP